MSLLTATMIGAAFFGASPEVVTSGPAMTLVTGRARFISTDYTPEDAAPVVIESVPAPVEQDPIAVPPAPPVSSMEQPAYDNGQYNYCQNYGYYCPPKERCWCPWCDCHDDDCEPSRFDRHLLTYCIGPGDFHPHYPYLPVYHGYYYFRPYNHMHVEEAAALAAQMGGDPRAPYSVEFLKSYFPPAPIESPIIPEQDQYPMLEDLLERKMPME